MSPAAHISTVSVERKSLFCSSPWKGLSSAGLFLSRFGSQGPLWNQGFGPGTCEVWASLGSRSTSGYGGYKKRLHVLERLCGLREKRNTGAMLSMCELMGMPAYMCLHKHFYACKLPCWSHAITAAVLQLPCGSEGFFIPFLLRDSQLTTLLGALL